MTKDRPDVLVEHIQLQMAPTLGRLGKWIVFMIKEIFETGEFLEIFRRI